MARASLLAIHLQQFISLSLSLSLSVTLLNGLNSVLNPIWMLEGDAELQNLKRAYDRRKVLENLSQSPQITPSLQRRTSTLRF